MVGRRYIVVYFMAEYQQNLNKRNSAEQTIDPSADVIVIRFELDDHCPLPQCVHEFLFNAKIDMQEENPQQGRNWLQCGGVH